MPVTTRYRSSSDLGCLTFTILKLCPIIKLYAKLGIICVLNASYTTCIKKGYIPHLIFQFVYQQLQQHTFNHMTSVTSNGPFLCFVFSRISGKFLHVLHNGLFYKCSLNLSKVYSQRPIDSKTVSIFFLQDIEMNIEELEGALQVVNHNLISESEFDYIYQVC